MSDSNRPNASWSLVPENWQRARDARLDAEYDTHTPLRDRVPEPDAAERTRVMRAMFNATCRLCDRTMADGVGVVIDGQCMTCVESWSRGA